MVGLCVSDSLALRCLITVIGVLSLDDSSSRMFLGDLWGVLGGSCVSAFDSLAWRGSKVGVTIVPSCLVLTGVMVSKLWCAIPWSFTPSILFGVPLLLPGFSWRIYPLEAADDLLDSDLRGVEVKDVDLEVDVRLVFSGARNAAKVESAGTSVYR